MFGSGGDDAKQWERAFYDERCRTEVRVAHANDTGNQREIGILRREIERLRAAREAADQSSRTAIKEREQLIRSEASACAARDILKEKLSEAEEKLAAAQTSLAEERARGASLETERDEARRRCASLEAECHGAAARYTSLEAELVAARAETDALCVARAETDTARAEAEALRREVEALRKAASSQRRRPPPEEPTPAASPPPPAQRRTSRRVAEALAAAAAELRAAAAAPAPAAREVDAARQRRGGRGDDQPRALQVVPRRGHCSWSPATLEKVLLALRDEEEDDAAKERIGGMIYKRRGARSGGGLELRNVQTLAANYGLLRREARDAIAMPALILRVREMLVQANRATRAARASAVAVREAERVERVVPGESAGELYNALESLLSSENAERVAVERCRVEKTSMLVALGEAATRVWHEACARACVLDVDVEGTRGESREARCCAVFYREELPFAHLSVHHRTKIVAAMLTSVIFNAFGRERFKFRVDGDVVKYWYYKVLRMTLTDAATDALEGRVSPTAHLREVVAAQAVLDPPYLVDVRTDIECPLVRALKEG